MLFSSKSKGFFVEQGDHAVMLARTSAAEAPFVIEELRECAVGDDEALQGLIKELQPKKSPSGYLSAVCGVDTAHRLVRRATLEPKRLKEPAYFNEVLSQQFRVEPEKYTTVVLNAPDGTDFDVAKGGSQKEVLFAGIPGEEIVTLQDGLLERGIYPERLELNTVATLGGLADCLAFSQSKTPTLVLEIEANTTHAFIVTDEGVEASRPIPQGFGAMIPVVQQELGLKDEESARKLFFSNSFDFTGMGPVLVKKLLKELQSYIGFYEVQTGQSVGMVCCTLLPPNLAWLENSIANAVSVGHFRPDLVPWLESRQITLSESAQGVMDPRWFRLLCLMTRYNLAPPSEEPNAVAAEKTE